MANSTSTALSYESRPNFTLLDGFEEGSTCGALTTSSLTKLSFSLARVMNSRPLSLKNFFLTQQVDTPLELKQGRSKFRPVFVEPFDRLVGMLSKHGRHPHVKLLLLESYDLVLNDLIFKDSTLTPSNPILRFLLLKPTLTLTAGSENSAHIPEDATRGWVDLPDLSTRYGTSYVGGVVDLAWDQRLRSIFFLHLAQYTPIFAMQTRKVDKLKFKHSRGKTGKYGVEWRYVPRYRRLDVVLRWLTEDIRFQKANTFRSQLVKSLKLLLLSPSDHLVYRNRSYVHRNVYSRYKSTLLRTLKKIH